jgi:hypothetical protein
VAALQFAADESATFGLNIWRSNARGDFETLLAAAPAPDIVVIRDTAAHIQNSALFRGHSLDADWRDHILSFRKELRNDNQMSPAGIECELQIARDEDYALLKSICHENFSGYPGHYQLSPYLEGSRAAAGMVRWLEQLRSQHSEGVFLVKHGGEVVGLLGYAYQQHTAELAIAAISATTGLRQRNLLLVEATRLVEQRLMQRGLRYFIAKTQATNTAIQRDLVRYVRCEPSAVFATVHMNLFLGQITTSGEDIPLVGGLTDSLKRHAGLVMKGVPLQKLQIFQTQGSQVVRLRALQMPRRDTTRVVFFAGYGADGGVVAVASAFWY